MPCGNEPKRVRLYFMGFLFRKSRLLSLFSNAGKQSKPICFFSKGRSGVSGKAWISRCFLVSRSNVGALFGAKRHSRWMLLGTRSTTRAHQERFGVTHVRPSGGPLFGS